MTSYQKPTIEIDNRSLVTVNTPNSGDQILIGEVRRHPHLLHKDPIEIVHTGPLKYFDTQTRVAETNFIRYKLLQQKEPK